ncbi:rod shape-determining protein RodA [Sphingosinicellaceae bacterium A1X5R2]|nr:rod shape-determining protein RodA [Pedomonas mirosovicensis]MCH8684808.1 rod shape-determining protein RodA [Pedomonas mirosovicensis]
MVENLTIPEKLRRLNWWIVTVIVILTSFGLAVLYSAAGDGGSFDPYAMRQGMRFAVFLVMMLGLATVDLKWWLKLAYPAYGTVLFLLVMVELLGKVAGGSQRWVDLGIVRLQPSEFMKLTIVLALARYYHNLPRVYVTSFYHMVPPLLMIAAPACLVLLQPDLGTATLITCGGIGLMFLAGVRAWLFWGGSAAFAAMLPIAWSMMHTYQQKRVLIFLNPEMDPLGSGYHITQSKIAIGSGGIFGKGFLQGTQSHLNFLPEMHTDFVFAMMAEEWGLMGGLFLLTCFAIILSWGLWISLTSRSHFGRLLTMGLTLTIFLYVAINLMMVMGLAPVVGVPLPLISYGGSAMLTVMIAFGMLLSCSLNRDKAMLTEGPNPR